MSASGVSPRPQANRQPENRFAGLAPEKTALFGEHLGDLHSVCGRALANLVAAAP